MALPQEGQQIVRACGSRGSNLIEVEYPDGRSTLCLLPAKFHKKLWIKKGSFLYIEAVAEADSSVTGQIVRVLYEDDVKQLKKVPGVWPPEFQQLQPLEAVLQDKLQGVDLSDEEINRTSEKVDGRDESGSDSDADLPPIQRIQNRRVVEYEVSESDSEEE
ncbi:hypothetical protein N2152v2_007177 [Parachlorella kessleri]